MALPACGCGSLDLVALRPGTTAAAHVLSAGVPDLRDPHSPDTAAAWCRACWPFLRGRPVNAAIASRA